MYLDFSKNQVIISESENENFLHLQDLTTYNLCFRLRDKKYEVPFISLPILLAACKKANFSVNMSEKLKSEINLLKSNRILLEDLKAGKYSGHEGRIMDILNFCISTEKKHGFTLTPAQRETIVYGVIGKRVLIANEIGTGKTLCAVMIAKYFIYKKIINKVIILLPASLVENFYNDIVKFFGTSGVMSISDEVKSKRKDLYAKYRNIESINFLVINYEKCNFDYEQLLTLKPEFVIVDEFHRMRNWLSAKRSENFFKLIEETWKPEFKIPMSGTPIENQLFDIYPIFKLISNGMFLGGQKFFESNFIKYETIFFKIWFRDHYILRTEEKATGFKNLEFVKNLLRPYIIRKKLQLSVIKTEQVILIDTSKAFLETMEILKKSTTVGSKRYHTIRQFLCHPGKYKFDKMINPKFQELKNILDQTTEKVMIFSFYLCSMDGISEFLKENNIKHLIISGKTKEKPLDTIKKFSEEDYKVLICSDRVSFGHNVQCARIMIEFELPLKPSTSSQRIGRMYRTGQTSNVMVYSFVLKNTVEEIIYEMFQNKKDIIQKAIEELDDKKLIELDKEFEKKIASEFGVFKLDEIEEG